MCSHVPWADYKVKAQLEKRFRMKNKTKKTFPKAQFYGESVLPDTNECEGGPRT